MTGIFTAFGLSASAGLNAYIPLLVVAVSARLGLLTLAEEFEPLYSWWAIGVIVVLGLIEFFVDKVPAVDTVNDIINTFIRPAAGALLFAANANVITEINPIFSVILGLFVSGGIHATKTLARPVVTASTAGTGNPVVSTIEDILAAVTSLIAVLIPWLVLLVAVIGLVMFLRWRMKRIERQERRVANSP